MRRCVGTTFLSLDGVKIREQEIFKATCAEGETIREAMHIEAEVTRGVADTHAEVRGTTYLSLDGR